MSLSWFYQLPLWIVLMPPLLPVPLSAMEVGLRLGSRRLRLIKGAAGEARSDVTLAAMLTLLGLMLAFTYSFSMSRTDCRKQVLIVEVKAISTAFLRADLALEPERTELMQRLLDYARSRQVRREELHTWRQLEDFTRQSLQAQSGLGPATKSVIARDEVMF